MSISKAKIRLENKAIKRWNKVSHLGTSYLDVLHTIHYEILKKKIGPNYSAMSSMFEYAAISELLREEINPTSF